MKLSIDIRGLATERLTGVGVYTREMVRNLDHLNNENLQLSLFSAGKNGPLAFKHFEDLSPRVTFVVIPVSNKILNICWRLGLGLPIDRWLSDSDLIWLPNWNFFDYHTNIPYIVTVHDLSYFHWRYYYSFKQRVWHRLMNITRLLSKAARVVAVSRSTAYDLAEYFQRATDGRVSVIYPGIAGTKSTDLASSSSKYDLPKSYILYLGTIEPRKNIGAIIKSWRLVRSKHLQLKLVIVGYYGWKSKDVLDEIDAENITWLDFVTDEERYALYQKAAVLIWPSHYEGFGFPPVECLAAGTPVIVSYKTSLPEILGRHALYVNPYDIRQLAALIDQVVSRPEAFAVDVRKITDSFVWKRSAEDFNKLLPSYAHRN